MSGERMHAEMAEQPEVLRRLTSRRDEVAELVRRTLPEPLRGIVLVARGSSDNAAMHGRYLLETTAQVPVALAAPSLQTRYGVRPRLEGFLAVGVSQSGATPEIVSTLQELRAGGAATIAITNVAGSPLARDADAALLLEAGEELAVPATKTFTAQAAAFVLLAEALAVRPLTLDWARAIDAVEDVLATPEAIGPLAERFATADRVLPVGRGWLYGAALEVGLKLAETTGLPVHGTSPADLQHGPIAAIHPGTQVLCLVAPGPVAADLAATASALRARGAAIAVVAEDDTLVPDADVVVPVMAGVPEMLALLPQVVRGQQLAARTAVLRGIDPDAPFALSKVTRTT
jgi:glutamine---fructose-6-phosphate transaminase (isomerizing)